MNNLIKLSRELVENLLNGSKQKLGKEYFFMFSISKFVLLKERILKKDSLNKILYFNNVKDAKYIPAILSFADKIKKNGSYQINNTSIILEKIGTNTQKLTEALWLLNKVRDSLAHGQYTIDLENDSILINNDHSNDRNNAYKLVCSIPIELLNSISFYIEEINEKMDEKELSKAYREYLEKIENDYDINTKKTFYNNYIIKINKYYNNILKMNNYKYNNYINKINNYSDNILKIDNYKYNNYINKTNNYSDNILKIDNYKYNDNYIASNQFITKGKNSKRKIKQNEEFTFMDGIADNKTKKILNNFTIEELYKLVKQLLEYKPTNEKQKEQINQIIGEFEILVDQRIKLEEQKIFDAKSSELMNEISDILGIKVGTKNADATIALYMYMNLVFSQSNEIDYSHICFRNLIIDVNPFKYDDKDLSNSNLSDNEKQKISSTINFEKNYMNTKNYINKLCSEFSEKMNTRIEAYYNNLSESFRHSLMDIYAEFYTSIMNSMSCRNQLIITSIRNSVEHGNYYVNKNGSLILYDQTDHRDNKNIKILCGALPQQLFDITKSIELGDSKDKYIMDDFFKELETIVDKVTLNNIMNTMNNFSKIIFGKDIDFNHNMDYMYQEAIAIIISQHISKK